MEACAEGTEPASSSTMKAPGRLVAGRRRGRPVAQMVGPDVMRFEWQLGVCTQEDAFDGDFTVRENLVIAASYFRPRPPDVRGRVDELLKRAPAAAPLPGRADHGPRSARARGGVGPRQWPACRGTGIVLTTHYMDEAERLSDALTRGGWSRRGDRRSSGRRFSPPDGHHTRRPGVFSGVVVASLSKVGPYATAISTPAATSHGRQRSTNAGA
jgi:hypothetical protein